MYLSRRPWLSYGVLALAVLAPLLRPGYILTLDMVFTPTMHMPAGSSNDYLLRILLYLLHLLLPGDVIEKVILFVVLLFSGVGMHRLVRYVHHIDSSGYTTVGAYVSGVLYTVNPFTYDRFMAGQYEVLLGYALLPWFMRLLLAFLDTPGWRRLLLLVACGLAISIVSVHDIGLLVILVGLALGLRFWRFRHDVQWRSRVCRLGLYGIGIALVASSYWLVPLLLGKGSVATQIAGIGTKDQLAFATAGGSLLGKVGNIVRLQGLWAETTDMYRLPQEWLHAWGLIGLMIWALVVTGGVSLWRARQRAIVVLCGSSAFVGGIVAVGALNGWPMAHIPLLAGYREPEKFVALIVLTYAVLIARGVTSTLMYCRVHGGAVFSGIVAMAMAVMPIVWTPTMLYGFAGQLHPVRYPSDWSTVNARLREDTGDFQTLFLPWHLYMRFNFEGRIIANPATSFFNKPIVVSDNPEFHGAALSKPTATKQMLDQMLPQAEYAPNLGSKLAQLHIKYVIVDHDDDYQDELYLAHRSDMLCIVRGATLDLYRNKAY